MKPLSKSKPTAALSIPGTTKAPAPTRYRLLCASDGLQKSGKTRFALTAPKPLLYVNTDESGTEGVEDLVSVPGVHYLDMVLQERKGSGAQEHALKLWGTFKNAYYPFLDKGLRTVVIDFFSDFVDTLLVAECGRSEKALFHRPKVYVHLREIIRSAARSKANLILTHRLKDEWIDEVDPKTGEKQSKKIGVMNKRVGFAETEYMVHCNLKHAKDSKRKGVDKFSLQIIDCRQNTDIEGEVLRGDMCTFPMLGMMVFPESSEGDWE